jgi:hypothetical protein
VSYEPPTATRPGFCLGCGRDVGPITVTPSGYGRPIPTCAHPSWCRRIGCQENRLAFNRLVDKIIREKPGAAS